MLTLEHRIKFFDILCARFSGVRHDKLLISYKIPEVQFEEFRLATLQYMLAMLSNPVPISNEAKFLQTFEGETVTNMTPNGKLMPKSHLVSGFNRWVQTAADMLETLNIEDLISSIRMPVLRFKAGGEVSEELIQRPFSTYKRHTESMFGHPRNTLCFHAPILGDVEGNHLNFFSYPEGYKEDSFDPVVKGYDDCELTKGCSRLPVKPRSGYLYLSDATSVHASQRTSPSVGSRVSMELFCLSKTVNGEEGESQQELDVTLTPNVFFELGRTKMFIPKDTMSGMTELNSLVDK
jgi:hypothetical protein